MISVRRNIVANYLASAWGALMGLAFIPAYIHYLGIESYGLIGVFAMLQASMAVLDMGLTPTLSREMARFDAGEHTPQSIRDLLHSIECVYAVIALVIAAGVILAAPWMATGWLKVEGVSTATVTGALTIAGGCIAMRWLYGLYRGAISGLQQQVWLAGCTAIFAALRGFGVVLVLAWLSPTIQAFFIYQGMLLGLEAVVLAVKVRRLLPRAPHPASFRWQSLRQVWHFAAGMTTIALLGILLTQVDKLLLSKLLSLTEFAYYTLASTMAGALYMVIKPLNDVVCPRLTELVARGDTTALSVAYHKFSQLLTLMVVPAALVLSMFSEHILLLWTRSELTAAAVTPLVSLLAVGTMVNGLMHVPAALQVAYGWTRLAIIADVLLVLLLVPAIYFGVSLFGAIAAAVVWLVLNLGYVFVAVPFMHRRLLPAEMWYWYLRDIFVPTFAVFVTVYTLHKIGPQAALERTVEGVLFLGVVSIVAVAVAILATPFGREVIRRNVGSAKKLA